MVFKDKGILKALWAGMFVLCTLLGFVPEPTGGNQWLLMALGVLFFVPPGLLLYQCRKTRDRKNLRLIRNMSLISLGVTLVVLIVSILSMLSSRAVGDGLHYVLIVVSTPMICCQYWFVSLLLWATLLWCAIIFLRELKK